MNFKKFKKCSSSLFFTAFCVKIRVSLRVFSVFRVFSGKKLVRSSRMDLKRKVKIKKKSKNEERLYLEESASTLLPPKTQPQSAHFEEGVP